MPRARRSLPLLLALGALAACAGPTPSAPPTAQQTAAHAAAPASAHAGRQPAAAAFPQLSALQGEWVAAGGEGPVLVTYHITGAGTALVETLLPGTPDEMISVYTQDHDDLVMTHYCSGGNQPRMRARTESGNVLQFDFDGGANIDPARDAHMHSLRIEFVSADEIRAQWSGWSDGKPDPAHAAAFHLVRKAG